MKNIIICIVLLFSSSVAFALPNEVEADRYLLEAKKAIDLKNFRAAAVSFEKIIALKLAMPDDFYFHYAKTLINIKDYPKAYDYLITYLNKTGRSGKFYQQVLELLGEAESEKKRIEQEKIAAEQEHERKAQKEREQQAAWQKEVLEFTAAKLIDKKFATGQMWTLPVPKKFQNNPLLPIKTEGTPAEAQTFCENLVLEGYDDWRVPSMKEFSTISGKGNRYNSINWSDASYGYVWTLGAPEFSAKHRKIYKDKLYAFKNGGDHISNSSRRANIMCVRTDSQEKFDSYFNHKYQVILFKGKKIMIEDRYMISNTENYYNDPDIIFDHAANYCEKLTLGGYDDWRVPTKKDMLERLPCRLFDELFFIRNSRLWYGESGLFAFGGEQGYLIQGTCKLSPDRKKGFNYVRCVRDVEEKEEKVQH